MLFTTLFSIAQGQTYNLDIGNPGQAGSTTYNAGTNTYTVAAGGADIWGTSDQFHFYAFSLTGSGTVVAQVNSISNTNVWAKSGVMIRSDTTAGSPYAAMFATEGEGVSFQWRSSTGGSSSYTQVNGVKCPVWVKVNRSGNSFSGYYSTDGISWIEVGVPETATLVNAALGGIAATAHNNAALSTSTLTAVSSTGYLHASGTQMLDGNGNPVLFTGGNTESWLMSDPFWTDGVNLSGTWNQPPIDTPFTESILGQIGSTTGDWIKVDDGDPSVSYSPGWTSLNWSGDPGYLFTQNYSSTVGATATFTFTGTQVQFFGYKRSDLGIAAIYIDGVLKANIDCYNATTYFNELLYTATGLTNAQHTLQVKVSGNKNASSSGIQVICDAFSYGTAATYGVAGNLKAWRDNKISSTDVAIMASNGLNCMRVALDCRLFGTVHCSNNQYQVMDIDTTTPAVGFAYLDKLASWCQTYQVYAILDMHIYLYGITDSQTSLNSQASLWQAIANRYKTNPYIAGYDLWNEPDDNSGSYGLTSGNVNTGIVNIYQTLINAIRQVDTNHMIFVEGYPWADRLDCFFVNPSGAVTSTLQLTDPAGNLAFEFHRYNGTLPDAYTLGEDTGASTDYSNNSPYLWSIQHQKKLASMARVPLWCGEAGNNSNQFLSTQQQLTRRSSDPTDYGISAGMVLWHYKKPNISGCDYYVWPSPAAGQGFDLVNTYWSNLSNYWSGNGSKPTPSFTNQQADSYIYNFCTSVNANSCQASPSMLAIVTGANLINGGFEASGPTQTPPNWNLWGANTSASYTEAGGHSGNYQLTHYASSSYQVYTYQDLSNLTSGNYTCTAWVKSSGGQTTAQVQIKYYDNSGNTMVYNIPTTNVWTKISIPNVPVSSGSAEIGFYSVASSGQYLNVDDVAFTIQ